MAGIKSNFRPPTTDVIALLKTVPSKTMSLMCLKPMHLMMKPLMTSSFVTENQPGNKFRNFPPKTIDFLAFLLLYFFLNEIHACSHTTTAFKFGNSLTSRHHVFPSTCLLTNDAQLSHLLHASGY
jgi:hypothetical protein